MTNVGTRYVVGTSNEIEYRREMSKKKNAIQALLTWRRYVRN